MLPPEQLAQEEGTATHSGEGLAALVLIPIAIIIAVVAIVCYRKKGYAIYVLVYITVTICILAITAIKLCCPICVTLFEVYAASICNCFKNSVGDVIIVH